MNFLHTLICGAGVGFPQIGYIWEIQSQLESHRLIQVEKASEIPKPNPPHLLSVSHISMALEEVEGAHPMPGCGKCTQLVPTLVVALQHLWLLHHLLHSKHHAKALEAPSFSATLGQDDGVH